MSVRAWHLVLALVLVLMPGRCATAAEEGQAAEAPSPPVVSAVASDGAFRVELRAGAGRITTAQRLELRLRTYAPPGRTVDLEPLRAALEKSWTIVTENPGVPRPLEPSREESPAALGLAEGDYECRERFFTLEPFLAGDYEIPAIEFRLEGEEEAQDAAAVARTEPITIQVVSVVPDESAQPADIKGVVAGPFEVPAWMWFLFGAGLAAVALALLAGVLIGRRKERKRLIRVTAHEVALRRLDELLARGLIERGEFKLFYQEVSLILRRYIEDRFGLRAPEQTTEEFLASSRRAHAQGANLLSAEDIGLLEKFLSHCDLVKFAAVEPTRAQVDESLHTVRAFIDRTRIVEAQLEQDAAGEVRRIAVAPGADPAQNGRAVAGSVTGREAGRISVGKRGDHA